MHLYFLYSNTLNKLITIIMTKIKYTDGTNYSNLGREQIKNGEIIDAIDSLYRAVQMPYTGEENEESHVLLASMLIRENCKDEAVKVLERLISLKHEIAGYCKIDIPDKYKITNPDFMIIGAPKSGTTSLWQALCTHPCIIPPLSKEIHFFNRQIHKGLKWYSRYFPPLHKFSKNNFITGEGTPNYLDDPICPSFIASLFPDIKLIIVTREPIDRAISHWHHNQRYNESMRLREPRNILDAIQDEMEILELFGMDSLENGELFLSELGYISRGLYSYHINKWLDYFPLSQILIIRSEEMFKNPEKALKSSFDFLGLFPHDIQDFPMANQGKYSIESEPVKKLEEYFDKKYFKYRDSSLYHISDHF